MVAIGAGSVTATEALRALGTAAGIGMTAGTGTACAV